MSRKSYSKIIVPFPTRLMFDISGRTRYSRVWQTGRLLDDRLSGVYTGIVNMKRI